MFGPTSPRFDKYSNPLDVKAAIIPGFYIIADNANNKLNAQIVDLVYRRSNLQVYDNYLNNTQYLSLPKKTDQKNTLERSYRPEYTFPLPMITARLYKSHIVPEDCRLNFSVEDVALQEKIETLVEDSQLWTVLDSVLPSYFTNGSMFLYFVKKETGEIEIKYFNTKHCFPIFEPDGTLKSVKVRYIYETEETKPQTREKIWRWYQYKFSKDKDVTYNNPVFELSQTSLPNFKAEDIHKHNYGFVPGEWIKTTVNFESNDGESFLENKLEALDCMNYLLSGIYSSSLTNLFPPLFGNKIDATELLHSMRQMQQAGVSSPGNDLFLTGNKEAALQYLEPALTGIQNALGTNEKFMEDIQHMFSTVLLNPEAVAPHANSGRALESLYKPVVQYVNCRRPLLKKGICNLMDKIETQTDLPTGTFRDSKKQWGSVFSDTIDDITKRLGNVINLYNSGLISRQTALENFAKDVGITNVQEELSMIESEEEQRREMELEDQQLMTNMQTQNEPTKRN